MERQLIVPATASGTRLDRYLQGLLGQTRSQIQRQIERGLITVNGRTVKTGYAVRPNDLVVIRESRQTREPEHAERSVALEPTIVDETADYVVIDKPAGMLVHGVPRKKEQSVADWALERWPDIANVGEHGRPGIVHRLDRDVSGLMLLVKTHKAYDWFKQQFHDRQIVKVYTALVRGIMRDESGTIGFPLARSRTHHGRMAARPAGTEGKTAETAYTVLTRYTTSTLLSVRIFTGRTHQIRAHLFALGYPVVGDTLYAKNRFRPTGLERLFLHATKLGFSDPNGEWQECSSPLPKELQTYLASAKKQP